MSMKTGILFDHARLRTARSRLCGHLKAMAGSTASVSQIDGESESHSKPPNATAVGICREVQLILCCAGTHIDAAKAERIKGLLSEEINWDFLIHIASQHGVMPLLYFTLKNTCLEAVPKAVLDQLRNYFYTNAAHNVFLTTELLKLLTLFEAHGIPAIPFKGPVLAASVYGNLSLRQFGDLDIL